MVRWHRSAWRAYWRWKSRRRSGRPRIPAELRQLIVRIATEHPRWGAVRIVGELRALGFEVSARTVSRYRRQALRRPPSQSWRTFLRNHASSIWAADLFTVQTLAFRTLYVLIVIDHDRRRIRHWNVTEHPIAPWIWQQMIEATAWGQQPGFLIRDRDRSYGGDFIARARRIGIETILTPLRVPNANAIAERVIGTLRRECLDHVIAVNEQHLRRVLGQYVQHYNAMRPHRSLALDSPKGRKPVQRMPSQRVVSKPVLRRLASSPRVRCGGGSALSPGGSPALLAGSPCLCQSAGRGQAPSPTPSPGCGRSRSRPDTAQPQVRHLVAAGRLQLARGADAAHEAVAPDAEQRAGMVGGRAQGLAVYADAEFGPAVAPRRRRTRPRIVRGGPRVSTRAVSETKRRRFRRRYRPRVSQPGEHARAGERGLVAHLLCGAWREPLPLRPLRRHERHYSLAASIVTVSRCGSGCPSAHCCTYSVPTTGGLPFASS